MSTSGLEGNNGVSERTEWNPVIFHEHVANIHEQTQPLQVFHT